MAQIDKLFEMMVTRGASDLHLSAGAPPILRLHGEMVPLDHPPLDSHGVQALIFEVLSDRQKKLFVENWELDCSYALPNVGRFRINVYMQQRGLGGVFRVIPEKIQSADELGIPKQIQDLMHIHRGLVLVTGPTGSGKSTTLASLIHTINLTRSEHIITIEDPIEFVHQNQKCLVNQREVSSHTKSFANALKASLREDPDIILVGEMRDLETISLALTAAETGHLVFGTLHTNTAAKTVDRIIDVFPEGQQAMVRAKLSETLRGVVAQTLFRRIDKKGRIPAFEVLVGVPAVGNLIREGKTFQIPSIMQTGAELGMITYDNSVEKLIQEGKIDRDTGESFLGKKKKASPGGGGHGDGHGPSTPTPKAAPAVPKSAAAAGGGGIRITSTSPAPGKKVG